MIRILLAALLCGLTISSADAALVDRGGGMIYDDVLKITWLKDANYAKTSGYDADGKMTWADANAWAGALIYGGFDDWRLPTTGTTPTCQGGNCTNSEMGYMFYTNIGAKFNESIFEGSNSGNLALFLNVAPLPGDVSGWYWSSTSGGASGGLGWVFNTNGGSQSAFTKGQVFLAWAVRDGDVASPVPLPAAAWLLLSGLGGLAGLGRRRSGRAQRIR